MITINEIKSKQMKKLFLFYAFGFLISIVSIRSQSSSNENLYNFIQGKYYSTLKSSDLLSNSQKDILGKEGIRIYDYLGNNTYLICSDVNLSLRTYSDFQFTKLGKSSRLSDEIANGSLCSYQQDHMGHLTVQYLPELTEEYIKKELNLSGIWIEKFSVENRLVFIDVNENSVSNLLNLPWIQYISCTPTKGEPEDREGKAMHRVNLVNGNLLSGINLTGKGVNVLVRDDGPVGPHIDFHKRLINQTFGLDGNHGDGVAGIIGSSANIDPLMGGMAPQAKIYVVNYQDDFLDNTLNLHQTAGVVITNSSYSNGCNAGYTAITQIVDKQINDNPTLMHCFSAGNSNNLDCGFGAGNQWGNITGGHKIGKNVITAANLMITGIVDASSSRGPTKDGRMKPDVSARGTNQNSTDINNAYQVFGGTSAASPGVAGTAALLYEAYRNLNSQQNPNSALIKACLMNTATDIGTFGPDYVYGCGVINANRAYQLLKEKRYQSLIVNHGENLELSIDVPAGVTSAKFMIYWQEKEASLNANRVLINNVDFEVINPSGTNILPLVLNPAPDATILASGAVPGNDSLNNFEQIIINSPSAGTYKIIIKGQHIPDNTIPIYFLYDFPSEELDLTFPYGGEIFNTLEGSNIYFNSTSSDTVKIELSTDGGSSWRNIKSVLGNLKITNWTTPNNINSDSCIIRLTQGLKSKSSNFFTITNPITGLRVDKHCPNEVTLSWQTSNKDSFIVYSIQGTEMNEFLKSNTNSISFPIVDRKEPLWYSVAGFRNGVLGRRTKAISIPDTLSKCVVANDLSIRAKNEWQLTRNFVSCGLNSMAYPELVVYNRNINEVNSFEIEFYEGNKIISEKVNKILKYRDSLIIKLNNGILLDFDGEKTIPIWIKLNSDEFSFNDTAQITIRNYQIQNPNGPFPLIEDFESNDVPSDWLQINTIPNSYWNVQSQISVDNNLSRVLSYNNSNFSYTGVPMSLVSRSINLIGTNEPYFYLDFAYHKSNLVNNSYDTLQVEILNVCTGSLKTYILYSAAGNNLYTTTITDQLKWVPASNKDWKTLALDLTSFKGSTISVRVNLIRGVFSNLYIDNFKVIERLSTTPLLSFSWDPKEICVTNLVKFTGNINPMSASVVSWNFGNNSTPRTATGLGPINVRYSAGGSRNVTMSTTVGSQQIITSQDVTTYLNPQASFNYEVTTNRNVKFTNYSTNIRDVYWDFGDGTNSTELNPQHQFDSAKLYKVILYITNPCGTNQLMLDVDLSPVGIAEVEKSELRIFPNPNNGRFEILSEEEFYHIELIGIDGKLLYENKFPLGRRSSLIEPDRIFKGMVIVKIRTNSKTLSQKVWIQ